MIDASCLTDLYVYEETNLSLRGVIRKLLIPMDAGVSE